MSILFSDVNIIKRVFCVVNLGYRLDNFLSKKFPQLAGDLYMNRNQIMRDPKLVMNPARRFANVLLGQGNTLFKAGGTQALKTGKAATPYGLLLSLGGSTDQKNNWSRLGYDSEEDYNSAIAAHKADQIANPQNYDPKALQYQAEFDAEGDKPFLNKVFSNLLSKSSVEDSPMMESIEDDSEEVAYQDFLQRTKNSPAMSSGVFDPRDLFKQSQMNDAFQGARNAGTLEQFAQQYPNSQTAKEYAINKRIPTSLDMEF